MKKIWRKDKTRNSSDQNSSFANRSSIHTISTIDENSIGADRDMLASRESIDLASNSNSLHNRSLLTRIETQASTNSNLQHRRMLNTKSSRSGLNKSNKSMGALIRPDWDTKVIKSGWFNKCNSEYTDESLRLFRVELKGSFLYLYKPPNELFNVKHFRIVTKADSQDSTDDLTSLVSSPSIADFQQPQTTQHSVVSSSPTLTQDLNSLRKPSLLAPDLNGSADDLFNTTGSEDLRSIRSKKSFPILSSFANGSEEDLNLSSLSLSPTRTPTTQLSSQPSSIKLTYYSAKYPHPNLIIDEQTQAILAGDLESICHSILFNTFVQKDGDNNKVTRHLLSLLPLFGDITTSLLYFKKYSDIFITDQSIGDYKENHDEQLVIPRKTELIMTQRLKLIVTYIKDNFPGMLLEDSIFKGIWDVLLSLGAHENVDDLKKSVHLKQQELYSLLNQVDNEDLSALLNVEFLAANFLKMDLQQLATEINEINLKFNRVWNPQLDCSLLFETIHENYSYYRKNPLIFDSSKNIHYLGRVLVNQLFLDPIFSKKSSKRAKIITKWIELGSHFDKIGDMVSWLAIATIICSVPVLRLQKTWDHIDPEIIRLISTDWAPVVFELDRRSMISDAGHRSSYHVIAPQGIGELYPKENVIPYFGDLYVKKPDSLTIKQCERKTQRVVVSLNRWQEYVNNVKNTTSLTTTLPKTSTFDLSRLLYNLLDYHISCPNLTLDFIMSCSLDIEPSSNGIFNKFHDNARSPLFLGSYPSVIFPEVLPKYKVYDQKVLIGAIGNDASTDHVYDNTKSNQSNVVNSVSSKSNGQTELQKGPPFSQPRPGRNQFLKNLRDIFNIDSCDLHVSDSIIFKAMIPESEVESPTITLNEKGEPLNDYDLSLDTSEHDHSFKEDSSTAATSKPRSRPSSVLFTESANAKRYSNYSSNLDDFLRQTSNSKNEESVCEMFTKAASLERLIDLLVLTSNIFASEINQSDVINYFDDVSNKAKNHSFKMDNGVYTVTFFATYRSFCSTTALLEGLLKRFIGAKSAAVSIYKRRESLLHSVQSSLQVNDDYPSWNNEITESHPDYDKVIWKYVAQIQIGILEALITLVKDHYDHFVDDLSIRQGFVDILKIIDNEVIIEWTRVLSDLELGSKIDDVLKKQLAELHEHYDQILSLYKKLRKVYIKKSYKPVESDFKSPNFTSSLTAVPAENIFPMSTDTTSIEKFINEFDELVGILFKRVTVNDLLNVFEIIEVQAGKTTTGLFNYQMQKLNTPDESLIVSDVFGWFASLYDTDDLGITKEYAVNKFPATVKSIIQLYYKLKTYFVAQITEPYISQEERIDRMKAIIILLVMARNKMKTVDLFNFEDAENCDVSPHVPSLIETAAINAIISPESRFFSESWIFAANSFRTEDDQTDQFGTLEDIIPKQQLFQGELMENHGNLTPCIGWLSERLIEIACYIPNMSVSNTKLINFDKRRYVYNCISNILDLKEVFDGEAVTNIENFKFLFKLKDDELFNIEDVKRAALNENGPETKIVLFQDLLEEERQILRKEHAKKAFLTKQEQERRNAAQRDNLHSKQFNSGRMSVSPSLANSRANNRQSVVESPSGKSRFKFSIFNKPSRPFSFGVGSSNPDRVVRSIDLPDALVYADPKQKPSLVLLLKDVSIFPIYRVPAAFKIDGSNDSEYFFQALSEPEKEDWIYKANYSRRHWYHSKSLNKNVSPNSIFGVPIEYICMREASLVPNIIDKLMAEIEVRGLEEVGIYRKSASISVLNLLRNEIDKYGDFNMENHLIFDINNATGCIKSFLREIPDSLIPDSLIPEFGEVRKEGLVFDDRLLIYKEVLPKLPYHNYHLLKRLIRHLKVVDEFSEFNKMTASNLSTIIGATFTEGASPELTKKYFGLMNFVCEDMIKHYEVVFEDD